MQPCAIASSAEGGCGTTSRHTVSLKAGFVGRCVSKAQILPAVTTHWCSTTVLNTFSFCIQPREKTRPQSATRVCRAVPAPKKAHMEKVRMWGMWGSSNPVPGGRFRDRANLFLFCHACSWKGRRRAPRPRALQAGGPSPAPGGGPCAPPCGRQLAAHAVQRLEGHCDGQGWTSSDPSLVGDSAYKLHCRRLY